ncbi:MAG: hypothetical protein A2186_03180 [Candidatus Levybacteria bacterium RIFOXYA1_FULL_41_10]|nr:MAG: hypothetical protein UT44_C0015G0022 [Candidatus Levybacteria bacterium GW2011_GWA1_39_32]KKR49836.1 MAG: hypothetical protein UT87_C0024G0004 [Candidatus Levybacteria bacterium GW2011_GWC1_40_19]KKR71928.1 MAG: hypothetical protein UU15_C0039G0006 [Candidatus Levybacteria bacterium GW2011_GWC2_40_7]KKR94756.1 MAG: hypothetical protein UU45_C0007G0004 [Candidatus Levybacteria bacterium GW2011_GWA2_41_15]KKS01031.1 MAG: hypothetical protein UU52_C0020G0004 [Candidatus Levybacteria bacter
MKKRLARVKYRKVLLKTVPLWFAILLTIESSVMVGLTEYYFMKKNFNKSVLELSKTTGSSEELVQLLKQEVIPQKGYVLAVKWNDVGKLLLSTGAIDKKAFEELFIDEPVGAKHMWHLENNSKDQMMISEGGSRFMVNTLWALGLVNKSKILDEGSMQKYGEGDVMSFASTGGWNLGTRPTEELYSSSKIIELSEKQEELVRKIAVSVYRPCCGNHTEFPDCNHGMAALGYIQLAVKQGVSEKRIYQDLLALNSFWFPQNYVELAAYFQKQNIDWKNVDPKLALSSEYSSADGMQKVRESVQSIPGIGPQGGGCSA